MTNTECRVDTTNHIGGKFVGLPDIPNRAVCAAHIVQIKHVGMSFAGLGLLNVNLFHSEQPNKSAFLTIVVSQAIFQ